MRMLKPALITTTLLGLVGCATQAQNPIYAQTTKYKGSNPYAVQSGTQAQIRQAGYQTQPAAPISYAGGTDAAYDACLSKESNRKLMGAAAGAALGGIVGRKIGGKKKTLGTVAGATLGGAAGYGIADKTIRCDQTPAPSPAPVQTTTNYSAPTSRQIPQNVTYSPAANPMTSPAPSTAPIPENTQSFGDAGTPGYYAVNGMTAPAPSTETAPQYASGNPITSTGIAPAPVPIQAPAPVPSAYEPARQAIPAGTVRHTLIPGDTLYSLARKSCTTVSELQRLNHVDDSFYIRAGDDFLLPAGQCTK